MKPRGLARGGVGHKVPTTLFGWGRRCDRDEVSASGSRETDTDFLNLYYTPWSNFPVWQMTLLQRRVNFDSILDAFH